MRDKLLYARQRAAEEPELFARNVEALEAVQPEPLTPADIEVNLGAIWVPVEYYRQFMYETFQTSGYAKVIDGGDNRRRIDIEYMRDASESLIRQALFCEKICRIQL